jgi:hypothetical protein
MATNTTKIKLGIDSREYDAAPCEAEGWLVIEERLHNVRRFYGVKMGPVSWAKSDISVAVNYPAMGIMGRSDFSYSIGLPYSQKLDVSKMELLKELINFAQKTVELEREKYEREKAEYEERERKRREEYQRQREERLAREEERAKKITAWQEEVYDLLKWYMGDRVRLLRWRKRATVFGTIDDVNLTDSHFKGQARVGRIQLTTEKNKPMAVRFNEIEIIELRSDDGRTYTGIDLPAHPIDDAPEPRQKRVITGATGRLPTAA